MGSTATSVQRRCHASSCSLPRHAVPVPKVYLIILVVWENGSGFGACAPLDPKLCRSIRGWPSGPQKKKTEHEAQQIRLVGALFRIPIDQGHPIRPIHDSTRFITDQIRRKGRTGRLRLQSREPDVKISSYRTDKERGSHWQRPTIDAHRSRLGSREARGWRRAYVRPQLRRRCLAVLLPVTGASTA